MNKAPTSNPWYQPWRTARRSTDADAADQGTAFGLDMSLDHWQVEALDERPKLQRGPDWLTRWTNRRKSAL